MLGFGLGLNKWRRVGGGFVGLLDLYPNAAFAPSIRLLRKNYSGGLVRARAWDGLANQGEADVMAYRVSSTEYLIDLNSTLENLDATAIGRGLTTSDTLADLVSTGASDYDGLVSAWYDQSLSNNATQSTAANQPKIVSGGSLVTENGKPALDFDGVNDDLTFTDTGTMANGCSSFHVLAADDAAQDSVAFYKVVDTNNTLSMGLRLNVIGARFREGGAETNKGGTSSTNQVLFAQTSDNTPIMTAAIDGVLVTSAASIRLSGVGSSIGSRRGNDYHYDGTMQEIVFFESDQSANRTAIETNINTFYSIYS